jgi:hypothetical protein
VVGNPDGSTRATDGDFVHEEAAKDIAMNTQQSNAQFGRQRAAFRVRPSLDSARRQREQP